MWQKLFLPAKTIFASPGFFHEKTVFFTNWQKPANPAHSQFTPAVTAAVGDDDNHLITPVLE